MPKKNEMWQAALARIQLAISSANFSTWFKNTNIIETHKDTVIISVPNNFSKEWLEKKYNKLILKTLKEINSDIKRIEFRVVNLPNPNREKKTRKVVLHNFDQLDFEQLKLNQKTGLNPRYSFENFVVGPSNELAHAAAWAVSENPGFVYNPLFIYGGVGLGKTHLLQAIGNKVIKRSPTKKIKYVPSERFTSEVINSIKNQTIDKFKEFYHQIDILIIDDVQFLAGKEKTQEEFFHLFNGLYEANKQIIISSDRPPKAIASLEERLKSRFEGGMIADISSPDFETRVAILKQKSQEKHITLDDEILEYIAENIQKNIRELEGALNRIIANQKLERKELNLETVQAALKNIIQPKQQRASFERVIQVVAEFYNLQEKDLFLNSRKKEIVKPRQVAMYILREGLNYSFPFIGRKFNGKDHTTAIYAYEKIAKSIEEDESLAEEINLIKDRIYNM